jgi:hypothetical protein
MLGAATPARADIIVMAGVNNQGTDNVLLTDATNVAVVAGTINSNQFDVFFESTGGNLNAQASGQAVIAPALTNDPFTNISFYLDNAFFTRAVFNLNSAADGAMRIDVTGINIDGGLFSEVVQIDMNGQNFFTVDAINGQLIGTLSLTALGAVEFEDLRQVRIGGAQDAPGTVPEPVTLALFGLGLAGVGYRARRR